MTIASEITRLQNDKAAMCAAIENKWVTVGNVTFDDYASCIDAIPTWWGGCFVNLLLIWWWGWWGSAYNSSNWNTLWWWWGWWGGIVIDTMCQLTTSLCISAVGAGGTSGSWQSWWDGGDTTIIIDGKTITACWWWGWGKQCAAGRTKGNWGGGWGRNSWTDDWWWGCGMLWHDWSRWTTNCWGGGGSTMWWKVRTTFNQWWWAGVCSTAFSVTVGGWWGGWFSGTGGWGSWGSWWWWAGTNCGSSGGCPATYYWWGGWGSGKCYCPWWTWYKWAVFVWYAEDGSYWFTCATWGTCCYACNWLCIHIFESAGTFTIVS